MLLFWLDSGEAAEAPSNSCRPKASRSHLLQKQHHSSTAHITPACASQPPPSTSTPSPTTQRGRAPPAPQPACTGHKGVGWHGSCRSCRPPDISLQVLVEYEDGRDVAAAVAVVGRRPHGDQRLLGKHVLEALLHQLVRSTDELQACARVRARPLACAWHSRLSVCTSAQ